MTYSNPNIFGYQAIQHFPYYQEQAIAQREKEVTDYLDSIADSKNNQSQYDTLVILSAMIYNLRNVYIFQDANQNRFYDDNKYLEFVNRQLTAFKDRVLVNYQHYLNLAPSFAPQYLDQNITILHELSHGQYSPIRQLNLEHRPIYSIDHYGQSQATFFSTQQQQNLETMMSYRPRIWTPAPPPVSLFSVAGYSDYYGLGLNADRSTDGDEYLAQSPVLASSDRGSDNGSVSDDEFDWDKIFDDIRGNYDLNSQSSQILFHSPHLSQGENAGPLRGITSFFQQDPRRDGGTGLLQQVTDARASLRATDSSLPEETRVPGESSHADDPLPPTYHFGNHGESTSPVLSGSEVESIDESFDTECDNILALYSKKLNNSLMALRAELVYAGEVPRDESERTYRLGGEWSASTSLPAETKRMGVENIAAELGFLSNVSAGQRSAISDKAVKASSGRAVEASSGRAVEASSTSYIKKFRLGGDSPGSSPSSTDQRSLIDTNSIRYQGGTRRVPNS